MSKTNPPTTITVESDSLSPNADENENKEIILETRHEDQNEETVNNNEEIIEKDLDREHSITPTEVINNEDNNNMQKTMMKMIKLMENKFSEQNQMMKNLQNEVINIKEKQDAVDFLKEVSKAMNSSEPENEMIKMRAVAALQNELSEIRLKLEKEKNDYMKMYQVQLPENLLEAKQQKIMGLEREEERVKYELEKLKPPAMNSKEIRKELNEIAGRLATAIENGEDYTKLQELFENKQQQLHERLQAEKGTGKRVNPGRLNPGTVVRNPLQPTLVPHGSGKQTHGNGQQVSFTSLEPQRSGTTETRLNEKGSRKEKQNGGKRKIVTIDGETYYSVNNTGLNANTPEYQPQQNGLVNEYQPPIPNNNNFQTQPMINNNEFQNNNILNNNNNRIQQRNPGLGTQPQNNGYQNGYYLEDACAALQNVPLSYSKHKEIISARTQRYKFSEAEKFGWETDGISIHAWIDDFERRMKARNGSWKYSEPALNEIKFNIIAESGFKGKAANAYRRVYDTHHSYEELVNWCISTFGGLPELDRLEKKCFSCKQEDRLPQQYYQDYESCISELRKAYAYAKRQGNGTYGLKQMWTPEVIYKLFLKNANNHTQNYLYLKSFHSLQEVQQHLPEINNVAVQRMTINKESAKEEKISNMEKRLKNLEKGNNKNGGYQGKNKKYCSYCDREGHTDKECYYKNDNKGYNKNNNNYNNNYRTRGRGRGYGNQGRGRGRNNQYINAAQGYGYGQQNNNNNGYRNGQYNNNRNNYNNYNKNNGRGRGNYNSHNGYKKDYYNQNNYQNSNSGYNQQYVPPYVRCYLCGQNHFAHSCPQLKQFKDFSNNKTNNNNKINMVTEAPNNNNPIPQQMNEEQEVKQDQIKEETDASQRPHSS